MTSQKYAQELTAFIAGGWNTRVLVKYFAGSQPISTQQIMIPIIPADLGPAAFGLEKVVQPSLWVVHHKGTVSPPESGTYYFVGWGDDVLMVRFNHRLVLAANWDTGWQVIVQTNCQPKKIYDYDYPRGNSKGFARGDAMPLESGKNYELEVLIGEQPGGLDFAALLIEKEGGTYQQLSSNPLLPVFRLSNQGLPELKPRQEYAPHTEGGPPWKVMRSGDSSLFH